ncbi:transposase family protein [Parafrankia sp. FMc2]|uniref:transposase family protein n=1 Tax=Parafrankia sp. FMc2 TaxID=3233196 RepID=UPI003B5886FF
MSGLLAAFGRVPDPRKPRGRRHSLAVVLTLATCAVLAGARSFTAIGEWAADAVWGVRTRPSALTWSFRRLVRIR